MTTVTIQARLNVAEHSCWRYLAPVTVNPVTDLGRSISKRRNSAHHSIAGAFLRSRCRVVATARGTPSGVPGSFCPGRPTRVQPSPLLAWPRAVTAPLQKELYP